MPIPQVTAYFEQIETEIHNELLRAKHSVKLCIAWMTWSRFATVFETLLRNNVEVSIIYDENPSNQKNLVGKLPDAIKRFPIRNGRHLMHNKFCIIDSEILITGSYNWSGNAWNHFENVVILKNDFKLIRAFMHEFEDLKAHSLSQAIPTKTCCERGCGSQVFNWAIMDEDEGLYETVELVVWEVCATRGHARPIGRIHIDHLRTHLGLADQPEYEREDDEEEQQNGGYSKGRMLHDFTLSRHVNSNFEHLVSSLEHEIHAVGQRTVINDVMVIEYDEDPIEKLFMHWRHMHHRKRIPQMYPQDDMESVDSDRILRGY